MCRVYIIYKHEGTYPHPFLLYKKVKAYKQIIIEPVILTVEFKTFVKFFPIGYVGNKILGRNSFEYRSK